MGLKIFLSLVIVMENLKIRIGTRGSALALKQTHWVKEQLRKIYPDAEIEIICIKTKGDKITDAPLAKIGGKGLFVKEIEEALLSERIDLAVHSLKDVTTELPRGLCLGAITEREDPRDVLISKENIPFSKLPEDSILGTSSLRRKAQILHLRPKFTIVPLRGNVDTRIKKMREKNLDAIILASAGIRRMGLEENITEYLPLDVILPAIGQGALAIEIREERDWKDIVSPLNHLPTALATMAERAFLRRLQGGCQVPIAAYAEIKDGRLSIVGMVAEVEGRRLLKQKISGLPEEAEALGTALADSLLKAGAREILEEVYGR